MRICILEIDVPPDELIAQHGSYGDMFVDWLGAALPEARFDRVGFDGPQDAPSLTSYDGFLLTGSRHGVYERLPWMAPLKELILEAGEVGVPLAGVCFGHQIMAEAYGGRAEKAARGWVLGNMTYRTTEAGARLFGDDAVRVLAFHQDQVVEAPPGSRVLLGNEQCPIAAIEYDKPALSVQFHPEFTPGYVEGLLDKYAGARIPEPLARSTRAGLVVAPDRDRVAETFASFFRRRTQASR